MNIFRSRLQRLAVLALFLFVMCPASPARSEVLIDLDIADLTELSQDPAQYISDAAGTLWMSKKRQRKQADVALKRFFVPWQEKAPKAPDMSWCVGLFDKPRWASNLNRWTESAKDALLADADMGRYPSMNSFAITVGTVMARVLPTDHPAFGDPRLAGQGFPFDLLQNSSFHVGTPLRVRHVNVRGDWYLCESHDASGWVKSSEIAFVSPDVVRRFRKGKYAVILKDDVPLRDKNGRTLCTAKIGALFPLVLAGKDDLKVLVPLRTAKGTATLAEATVSDAAQFPLLFTAGNVAQQARRFMGGLYGWGGAFEDRDCSATMRDLFAPFGFALPRNSAAQARHSGKFMELSKKSAAEKRAALKKFGIPFRTLVGMRGHVGLFIGLDAKGEPVIMHNMWGVRLGRSNDPERSGRLVLGRTVITTLTPGAERLDVSAKNYLLERVITLTCLPGISFPKKR